MGKRGQKPKGKVKIKWSSNFAYALGLLASDGNLSPDGRHICFTTKELDQAQNFMLALDIKNKIGTKSNGISKEKKYFIVQFSDVLFYNFLISVGITPSKSKTLREIKIPHILFFDFLRGLFDGDGYTYSYFDPRWKSSFMWYIGFCSASPKFIKWLRKEISERLDISGHVTASKPSFCLQLKYAKSDSIKIIRSMYKKKNSIFLNRKKLKIIKMLSIVGEKI